VSNSHQLLAREAGVARADRAACIPCCASFRVVPRLPLRAAARRRGGLEHRDGVSDRACRPAEPHLGRRTARRPRSRRGPAARDIRRAGRRLVSGPPRRDVLQFRRGLPGAGPRCIDGWHLGSSSNGLRGRATETSAGPVHALGRRRARRRRWVAVGRGQSPRLAAGDAEGWGWLTRRPRSRLARVDVSNSARR
jgi:hypothetical protein